MSLDFREDNHKVRDTTGRKTPMSWDDWVLIKIEFTEKTEFCEKTKVEKIEFAENPEFAEKSDFAEKVDFA